MSQRYIFYHLTLLILLSYSSQDVLQLINYGRMSICYIILLIEIVGDAVELRKRIVAGLYLRTPLDHLGTIVRLDVFPLLGADGKYMVARHFGYPWTMGGVGAEQIAKMVPAVRALPLGKVAPIRLPNEAMKSIWDIRTSEV